MQTCLRGKFMSWDEMHIVRLGKDKIAEHWVNGDLMQQLMMGSMAQG